MRFASPRASVLLLACLGLAALPPARADSPAASITDERARMELSRPVRLGPDDVRLFPDAPATVSLPLVAAGSPARARDENFHVYLCLGQSNMEGYPGIPDEARAYANPRFRVLAAVDFPALNREQGRWYPATPPLSRPNAGLGPADYFGRAMVEKLPARVSVGVVNVAVGGCRIELFDTSTADAYIAAAPDWMRGPLAAYGGSPYRRLVELGKLAARDGVIRGILLHQGESNTDDREWPAKVKAVYENLLRDLDLRAEDVPLLAGGVVAADQQGVCAGMNSIIATLPETIPTAHFVPSDGCAALSDHLHFSPEGYATLGRRYAETMLRLLNVEN